MEKLSLKLEIEPVNRLTAHISITVEGGTGTVPSTELNAHRDLLFERVEEVFTNHLRRELRPVVDKMRHMVE